MDSFNTTWTTTEPGQCLMETGKPIDAISLIVRGKVRMTSSGKVLGELQAGDIVGSALLLSGTAADVDAVTPESARLLRWEVGILERYLSAHPETRIAVQRHLARDLSGKLLRLSKGLLNHSPTNTP